MPNEQTNIHRQSSDSKRQGAKRFRAALILSIFLISIMFSLAACSPLSVCYPETVEVSDIAYYGKFKGNYNNSDVKEFIYSFFPAEIEDYFDVKSYSYRAMRGDAYAFEAFLEFQIEDPQQFQSYVNSITASENWTPFPYDSAYQEYSLDDSLRLHPCCSCRNYKTGETPHYHIGYANIKRILYSEQTQTIIYVALGVWDGGYVTTDFLHIFFDRFGIDPIEYADQIW